MATTQQSWFNTELWKNHYNRTQRMGAQKADSAAPVAAQVTPPSVLSGMAAPPAATPAQNVVRTMPTPEQTAPTPVAVNPAQNVVRTMPTPEQTAPQDPAVATQGALDGQVLQQMAAGLNGKPLPGTEAALRQGRESLAQYARSLEAQAGARATKTGAVGQGTAASLADDVKSDVLGKMSENVRNSAQIVSDEKQALLEKATQAGQFQQTLATNKAQFQANLEQRKAEFDKTFGSQESSQYLNQLERLGADNPVLAEKLTNYLMGGKTGPVGEFTPEEKTKLAEYVAKKQGQDDKLTEVMNKVLEGLPAQIAASNQTTTDATAAATATKTLNTLPADKFLSETEFKALAQSGGIPSYTATTLPKTEDGVKEIFTKAPGGIINLGGEQYRFVKVSTSRDRGTGLSNTADSVMVTNSKGEKKYVYNGKIYDTPPKVPQAGLRA